MSGFPRNAEKVIDAIDDGHSAIFVRRSNSSNGKKPASVRHAEEMKSRSFETNPTSDKVDCVRLKLISDDGVFELR